MFADPPVEEPTAALLLPSLLGFLMARIIPYCIRPEAKALCMRSRVTISLTVRYQILGPAKTTGQGSHTPTQLEWRQLGSVAAVQSARSTSLSLPVPCREQNRAGHKLMQCLGVLGWQGVGQ